MNELYSAENKVSGITLVPEQTREQLNPCQAEVYQDHRRELVKWMISIGKDPEKSGATQSQR